MALVADAMSYSELPWLFIAAGVLAFVMLVWDTIEVGRNDATNIVNSVFGARILDRRNAVWLAGIGVVLGAGLSSGVMETARSGIFDPTRFSIEQALSIYISVYIIDTILLNGYSAFGMPVSTTMTLVFSLLGASFFLGLVHASEDPVKWSKAGEVLAGVVCSIFLAGGMGFMIQRAGRGAIRDKSAGLTTLLLHGGWIGGGLMAGLTYFMLGKGMKEVAFVKAFKKAYIDAHELGPLIAIFALWVFFAIIIHLLLVVFRKRAANLLFPVLTVIGMICTAFAFGQNDLANCASPGLAAFKLIDAHREHLSVEAGTKAQIPKWALFGCGALLVVGMATRNAHRVTSAEVRTGSAGDHVELWAPRWCISLATFMLRNRSPQPSLAPAITRTSKGKTLHYDPLRACVIVCVSASVIATASALNLPVSTTYVAFAAVLGTGMADRIFVRGDAALKLGRFVWVVFSWFMAAVIATVAAGLVCLVVYNFGVWGMGLSVGANLLVRKIVKRRSDAQEERVRREAEERMHPEDYAREDEEV